MSEDILTYSLSKHQEDFVNIKRWNGERNAQGKKIYIPTRAAAIVGAKGSGKTYSGALFIPNMIARFPGQKGVFSCATIRQTFDIWEQNIEPVLKALRWKYTINKQEGIVRFPEFDSMLHLRSAETPTRIEGMEYAWGWADECSLYSFDFLTTLHSRIRALSGTGYVRFSSMPDDPSHPMYAYFEANCDVLHEINLSNNPNRNFVEQYTKSLKATYDGALLERYLYGKRVSLDGLGVFYLTEDMRINTERRKEDEIVVSWDFNVEYCAVTVWQKYGKTEKGKDIIACLASHQMKGETVYDSAKQLANIYKDHTGDIILIGDASGENRTAIATGSMWTNVNKAFQEVHPGRVYNQTPNANPHERDTIECFNWATQRKQILFDREKAHKLYVAMSASKYDKHGKIDKKDDYKPNVPKTHEVDTARYAGFHFFKYAYKGDSGAFEVI